MRLEQDYAHSLALHDSTSLKTCGVYREVQVRWLPPPHGWVKCNSVGSVLGPTKAAGCGGLCRDEEGRWLFGMCRNLGSSNVLWAELWAIHSTLEIAWEKRFPQVLFESDSHVAIHLINNGCDVHHLYASIVSQIQALAARDWTVQFSHVFWEANGVADCLASLAHTYPLGVHRLEGPPASCWHLLLFDCTGVSYPRSTLV